MAVSNTSFEWKKGGNNYPFGQGLLPPIFDFIGFELERASATSIEGRFVVSERSAQAFGVLHGGISAFLSESLGSMGAFLASGMQRVAGVEVSTSHLQPAPVGTEIEVKAIPIHIGRRLQLTVYPQEITERLNYSVLCPGSYTGLGGEAYLSQEFTQ